MRFQIHAFSLALFTAVASCAGAPASPPEPPPPASGLERPSELRFGASLAELRPVLEEVCESVTERRIEPIDLPTASSTQIQLDCTGFPWAGRRREAELVFADGVLDLAWILVEPEELADLVDGFVELYDVPSHEQDAVTFFLDHGAAVRREPPEVLFLADRLKPFYAAFLAGQTP